MIVTLVILALGRQEDHKFEASLIYIVRHCLKERKKKREDAEVKNLR
jgi:hypothetical protein